MQHVQPPTSQRTLAALLQTERLRRGWSQQDLADQLETTTQTVSRWERGVVMPSPYYRQRLSDLFGVSVSEPGLLAGDIERSAQLDSNLSSTPPHSAPAPLAHALPSQQRGTNAKRASKRTLIMHATVGAVLLMATILTLAAAKPLFSAPARASIGTIVLGSSERFQGNSPLGMNDEVSIRVALPPAPPGMSYYAWMADNGIRGETRWRLLGQLTEKNDVTSLFYSAPQQENLLVRYSQFLVTQEATDVPPLQPSSRAICEASISAMATPGDPHHYSLLDHLRHLLAYDPTLAEKGIQGGLDYWLVRNTLQVQANASGLVGDWHARRLSDMRERLIRILDYLDGSSVGADVPSGTPWLVQSPGASVGLLTLSPDQEPEGYVLHTDVHLEGVMHSPGASTSQQRQAEQIRQAMNEVGLTLSNVRQDAIQLLRMDDMHLTQRVALHLLTDAEGEAQDASNGHQLLFPSTSSGSSLSGLHRIDRSIQQLATLSWIPV